MNDTDTLLGPWLQRFLTQHVVTERNLSRNTCKSYRDSFKLLVPFACSGSGPRSRRRGYFCCSAWDAALTLPSSSGSVKYASMRADRLVGTWKSWRGAWAMTAWTRSIHLSGTEGWKRSP